MFTTLVINVDNLGAGKLPVVFLCFPHTEVMITVSDFLRITPVAFVDSLVRVRTDEPDYM